MSFEKFVPGNQIGWRHHKPTVTIAKYSNKAQIRVNVQFIQEFIKETETTEKGKSVYYYVHFDKASKKIGLQFLSKREPGAAKMSLRNDWCGCSSILGVIQKFPDIRLGRYSIISTEVWGGQELIVIDMEDDANVS